MMKYFRETGKTTCYITSAVGENLQQVIGDFDASLKSAFEGLE